LFPRTQVVLAPIAYCKMRTVAESASTVVGILGTVAKMPNGDYLIEDIYIPQQRCNSTSSDIPPEAMGNLMLEMMREPDGLAKLDRMRFYGLCFRQQDVGKTPAISNYAARRFLDQNGQYSVYAEINQNGDTEFTVWVASSDGSFPYVFDAHWVVFDPETRVVYDPTIHGDELAADGVLRQWTEDELARKVTQVAETPPPPPFVPGGF
jgi:hypothetical protein